MEALEKVSKLKELSHDTFYKMAIFSQYVIDAVSDIEDDLEDMTEEQKEAKIYEFQNVLEIINPDNLTDIEALKSLIEILS